ncbi:MAG: hypothetical protein ACI93R_004178 [Flavobacteriales bacterium]|jgi:hypothetical protein
MVTNKQKHHEAIQAENIEIDDSGVSAIGSQKGKVLSKGVAGFANLEHNISLTTDKVFRPGFITK